MIVLGPHRANQTRLGSTAYRVVHGAQVPCLVLPVTITLPLHRVLVPLDISEASRGAFAVAISWASALRRRAAGEATTVIALHVTSGGEQDADTTIKVTDEVKYVRRDFGEAAGVAFRSVVETGEPARVILQRAGQEQADMIVMGTRGQHPREATLGSVSLEVVTRAERPVLLVPPDVGRRPIHPWTNDKAH